MGMDVSGINPTSDVGSYFRRNVWGWRPLWNYVEDQHADIAAKVEYAHSNEGDGLSGEDSRELASRLVADIDSGRAASYIEQRDVELAALPMEPCEHCDATGTRTDAVGVKSGMPEKNWCNGCDGKGEKDPWARSYYLDVQDLIDFADFLADCGGFHIY